MRPNRDEIVPGIPGAGKSWLLTLLLYVLFLLWLEPLIDFIFSLMPPDKSLGAIDAFNEKKHYIAITAFAIARSLPILLFLWFGFQVFQSQRLPPKAPRLPITLRLIQGANAKYAGMGMMVLALLLLLREIFMITNTQPL